MSALPDLWPYAAMFVSAFGAATLVPFSSEVVLLAAIKAGLASVPGLVAVATLGNVGGSVFNWWLGGYARHLQTRPWFPFKAADIDTAAARFERYGLWILLLAWVPVIGDPLTFIAGVLRVRLVPFLALVTAGKAARYIVLAAAV